MCVVTENYLLFDKHDTVSKRPVGPREFRFVFHILQ